MAVLIPIRLPCKIDQGAAGIAGIDGGIGLNEVLIVFDPRPPRPVALTIPMVAVLPMPNGSPMASTTSPTCSFEESPSGRVGQTCGVDFDHGDIRLRIGADQLGLKLAIVAEVNLDIRGAVDHVVIGEDRSVGGDDHAGTEALLALCDCGLRLSLSELIAEELPEERIVEKMACFRRWFFTTFEELMFTTAGSAGFKHRGKTIGQAAEQNGIVIVRHG